LEITVAEAEEKMIGKHRRSAAFLLAAAHRLTRARMVEALGGEPIHMGHVVLLASLWEQNDLTQTQLTAVSGIEKSSVVLFLDVLEKDGWVQRRAHPTDRRAHHVHLTDAGRKRFVRIAQKLEAAEKQSFSALSPAERIELEKLLSKLISSMGADAQTGATHSA
jgi:DNA-binding MarR family transcriptional regulator